MRRRAIALVAIVAAAVGALWGPAPAQPAREPAPSVTFSDVQGRTISVEAFAGKVVLLTFWASWCVPCRTEMPQFDSLQANWEGRGFVVVPVSIDARGLPAVEAFYAEQAIAHLGKFLDPSREAAKSLGFIGIPSALILDRRGRIVTRIEGPINWESARISSLIEKLISED